MVKARMSLFILNRAIFVLKALNRFPASAEEYGGGPNVRRLKSDFVLIVLTGGLGTGARDVIRR